MNYYKDKKTNQVYAYDASQLEQVARLTELEHLLTESEPDFIDANSRLQHATQELEDAKQQLEENNVLILSEGHNEESQVELFKKREELMQCVDEKSQDYNDALLAYHKAELIYLPLKNEYNAVVPAIFDIRENLKLFKKMTVKEVDAHTNPPVPKEQLIAEAAMQKQSCADDAEKNITILERKVRLNMATDDDKNSLTAWEIYSIKVSDIDTSTAPDIEWPVKP
ncbi:tail fiber assembly protein [Providencia sp. PROV202]|uniref:tail fiber assembly protein n=1 Tax=Providencia sp. PROV202 TaxID=2949902 RepID=UPI00234A6238|nr:tail fiber assembly protein [Providencia sp. PROV202]